MNSMITLRKRFQTAPEEPTKKGYALRQTSQTFPFERLQPTVVLITLGPRSPKPVLFAYFEA